MSNQLQYFRVQHHESGVVELVLNRPAQLNVVDDGFFTEFDQVLSQIENHNNSKVILLWSEGKLFTAGLDLSWAATNLLNDGSSSNSSPAVRNLGVLRHLRKWQNSITKLNTMAIPVIVCVHGKCIGAGVDIITACDIRLCTSDATFSVTETKIGIVADLGTLQRIAHVSSRGFAREMAFTGKDVGADRALKFGLVNEIYKDKASLLEGGRLLAEQIASNSPLVVQSTKVALNYADEHNTQDSLNQIALWNSAFLQSEDLVEAVSSFMEKRKPIFKNRL